MEQVVYTHRRSWRTERLAERAWWTKSQSSLLSNYFRLSGQFIPCSLPLRSEYPCSHCTKVGYRTYPISDRMMLHFRDRRGTVSLRYRNRTQINVLVVMREQKPYAAWFSPGGGGDWVFFGWVYAARASKLAPRSKKKIPLKLIPRSWNRPIFYTPF